MSDLVGILIAIGLLAGNAFFVGAEFALISARRASIEARAEEGGAAARITLGAMERVSLMMACAQLGITMCTLGLGSIGEPAVAHLMEPVFGAVGVPESLEYPISFVLATALIVYLHVVVGEMIPKNLALALPDRSALLLGPPLVLITRILGPIITFLNWIANMILRALGVEPRDEVASAFTRDQVAAMVEEAEAGGTLDSEESELTRGALKMGDRDARSVMMPMVTLVTAPEGTTPAEVEALVAEHGFSRLPVRAADGRLTGYLHLKDVLAVDEDRLERPIAAGGVRRLPAVDAAAPLQDVVRAMQRSGAHLARVDDAEAGSTVGVVALEDALEELVGEIRDERAGTPTAGAGSGAVPAAQRAR